MEKTYKIKPGQVAQVATRDLIKKGLNLLIGMLLFILINFRHANETFFLPVIIVTIAFGAILWSMFGFKKTCYANYKITIDENGIYKHIDIDDKLKGIMKFFWSLSKQRRIMLQSDISLKWNQISKISETNQALYVKTANANNFYRSGQIVIPKYIQDYAELKQVVESKINTGY